MSQIRHIADPTCHRPHTLQIRHVTDHAHYRSDMSHIRHVTYQTRHRSETSHVRHVTDQTRHISDKSQIRHVTHQTCHTSDTSLNTDGYDYSETHIVWVEIFGSAIPRCSQNCFVSVTLTIQSCYNLYVTAVILVKTSN